MDKAHYLNYSIKNTQEDYPCSGIPYIQLARLLDLIIDIDPQVIVIDKDNYFLSMNHIVSIFFY
jgi:hypothetical protein